MHARILRFNLRYRESKIQTSRSWVPAAASAGTGDRCICSPSRISERACGPRWFGSLFRTTPVFMWSAGTMEMTGKRANDPWMGYWRADKPRIVEWPTGVGIHPRKWLGHETNSPRAGSYGRAETSQQIEADNGETDSDAVCLRMKIARLRCPPPGALGDLQVSNFRKKKQLGRL